MGPRAVAFVLLAALCGSASAAPKMEFNVDFSIGWAGRYRPLEWTPVEVTITSNAKEAYELTLEVSVQQDELTRMTVRHRGVLTPDLPLHVPMALKIAFAAQDCQVAIYDAKGRRRWWHEYGLWGGRGGYRTYSPGAAGVQTLDDGDVLIGVAGPARFGLGYLPQRSVPKRSSGEERVHVCRKLTRLLPWDWTGYASLDLLVLYDVDFQQMRPKQAEAIAQWVGNGGRALIVLGGRGLGRKHPVASLVPFEPGPQRQVKVSEALLGRWGCSGTGDLGDTLACWQVPADPGRGWKVRSISGDGGAAVALLAHGPAGFGRVGVLTCDPSVLGGKQQENLARFWIEHIGPLLGGKTIEHTGGVPSGQDDGYRSYHHRFGVSNKASNRVLEHLLSIPELRPLSIWVVIGLLAALAVVIGPLDYFVLKRLDRLPLTWVTSASCVLVFTVAAYYGVRALRAGAVQVRMVSVVDGIDGGGAWRSVYSGIFAPASDDYGIEGLRQGQWWSSVVPGGDDVYAYSSGGASRRIGYQQGDGHNLPVSVPINIWSMQCMIAESPAEAMPFAARLTRDANGRLTVAIDNHSDVPISTGYVRLSDRWAMRLGAVAPKASRRFTGTARRQDRWEAVAEGGDVATERRRGMLPCESAFFAWGSRARTAGIEDYLDEGAAVVCVVYEGAAAEFTLKKRVASVDHIRLGRLVVPVRKESSP